MNFAESWKALGSYRTGLIVSVQMCFHVHFTVCDFISEVEPTCIVFLFSVLLNVQSKQIDSNE